MNTSAYMGTFGTSIISDEIEKKCTSQIETEIIKVIEKEKPVINLNISIAINVITDKKLNDLITITDKR